MPNSHHSSHQPPSTNASFLTYSDEDFRQSLKQVRTQRPLTHCITNTVVQNFTANILHAVSAVPAMNVMNEEVASFVSICQGLLINFGTLSYEIAENMKRAAISANQHAVPWVLDPVAIGPALNYRTELAQQLLAFKPTVVRANPSEILTLAQKDSASKGPDGLDSSEDALSAAVELARRENIIIAMTDKIDYITDGKRTYRIDIGSEKLTRVTGTGCSLSALVAAFVGSSDPDHYLEATVAACYLMALAGNNADKKEGMGSFAVELLDQISLLSNNA